MNFLKAIIPTGTPDITKKVAEHLSKLTGKPIRDSWKTHLDSGTFSNYVAYCPNTDTIRGFTSDAHFMYDLGYWTMNSNFFLEIS